MNIKRFWKKLGKDERLNFEMKSTYEDFPGEFDSETPRRCSWRRRKKMRRMQTKREGLYNIMLNDDNFFKATDLLIDSDVYKKWAKENGWKDWEDDLEVDERGNIKSLF